MRVPEVLRPADGGSDGRTDEPARGGRTGHDAVAVALAEIELCGELMIAASVADAAGEERLSAARIDEVLGARGA